MYLMIQNTGVAPVEAFTLLGAGTTRYSGVSGTIGQFASGAKHSITLLLRKQLSPVVFCGNLRLEFDTKSHPVNDGLMVVDHKRVICHISGKTEEGTTVRRTEDLGWTLDFGTHDWTKVSMALREFVSNAIDRTLREGKDISDITVCKVEEKSVRAKAGTTRVFVKCNYDVERFYETLAKRFLHFEDTETLTVCTMPKAGRELEKEKTPVIYKKGVFVRQIGYPDKPSLFDYNFGDELELDECRNVDDYKVVQVISQHLVKSNRQTKLAILEAIKENKDVFELHCLSSYYMRMDEKTPEMVAHKKEWKELWDKYMGENAVITAGMPVLDTFVMNKGYTTVNVFSDNWRKFLADCGVKSELSVLNPEEQKGITFGEPTADMVTMLDRVWHMVEAMAMTNGKAKPAVKSFDKQMEAGANTMGMYKDNTVFVHKDYNGTSRALFMIVLEEVAHHCSGATDMSRDFQEWLLKLITNIAY